MGMVSIVSYRHLKLNITHDNLDVITVPSFTVEVFSV